jgi:hypothetical protein
MSELRRTFLALSIVVAAAPVAAQQQGDWQSPVYKCSEHSYSQAPCGKPFPHKRVQKTFDVPPQDRARQMQRAQLPPDVREKCNALEAQIRSEEARLKAKPAPTQDELGDLSIRRVNYREMRC